MVFELVSIRQRCEDLLEGYFPRSSVVVGQRIPKPELRHALRPRSRIEHVHGLASTHVKRFTLLYIVQMLEFCDEVVLVQLLRQRSQVNDASKELFSLGCLRCRCSDVCVIIRAAGYVIRLRSTAVIRRCRLCSNVVTRRLGFTCTFQGVVDEMSLRFVYTLANAAQSQAQLWDQALAAFRTR